MRLLLIALVAATPAYATDPNVVIFGGGWGPEGTQASIEAHVAALVKALSASKPDVLFAGDSVLRSVQVARDSDDPIDAVLGSVFDRRDHLQVDYRKKRVPSAKASRQALLDSIARNAGDDGLIVLGAGHGSPAEEGQQAALEMWGPDDRLPVGDLAAHLDRTAKGPVAFVLGHCHSGAFTDLIYVAGKPPKIATPSRCVLAAVPRDQEAAGCTPDLDDPSADAYMAMIAEAFEKGADFDGDGATSLAEAHAYARINDGTVDLPVASSEVWLRSRLGSRLPNAEGVPIAKLLAGTRPTERAVLEQLQQGRLLQEGPKAVVEDLEDLEDWIDEGSKKLDEALDGRDLLRRQVVDAVLARWPELVNPYHHVSRQMLAGDAREVVEFIKKRPEWVEMVRRDEEIRARDQQVLSLEKRAAVLSRFVRTVQVVAGERMLSRRDRATLRALVTCESMKPRVR